MQEMSSKNGTARLFPYRELKYYSFGLRTGFSNLFRNGLALGWRRTIGKITQPINSYTRFPEYHFFDQAINVHVSGLRQQSEAAILDVGSPKLLGLYLAFSANLDLTLTDITELNIEQYRVLWEGLRRRAQGQIRFELQDARSLTFPDGRFDIVYSMSVIEHVQGDHGDSQAVREMVRVLKPGGLLLISVPFASRYQEQSIVGFADAARETHDTQEYFFQRIYDSDAFRRRILAATGLRAFRMTTVWRRRAPLIQAYARLGQNIQGALGFLNPFLSSLANRSSCGINPSVAGHYGRCHSARDIYGDLIVAGIKPD